jgi:hypothetical protein
MSRLLGPVEAVLDAPQSPGTSNDEYFPDREEKEKELSSINVFAEVTSVSECLKSAQMSTTLNCSPSRSPRCLGQHVCGFTRDRDLFHPALTCSSR